MGKMRATSGCQEPLGRPLFTPGENCLLEISSPKRLAGGALPCSSCALASPADLARQVRDLGLGTRIAFLVSSVSGWDAHVPGTILEVCRAERLASAVRNRMLAAELQDLLCSLYRCGLHPFPLKGTTLSTLLHGDLTARFVSDIDLAVPPRELVAAAQVLRQAGYQVLLPLELLAAPLFFQGTNFKTSEVSCVRAGPFGRVLVELHWSLFPGEAKNGWPLRTYDGGICTLTPTAYFYYLCCHLAARGWTDLGKLCDVGDFYLKFRGEVDFAELRSWACSAGYRLNVGISLELLALLFGIRCEEFPRDARAREAALRVLRRPFQRKPQASLGAYHLERIRYLEGLPARCSYLRWLLRPTHEDWQRPRGGLRSSKQAHAHRWLRLGKSFFEGARPAQGLVSS
jgi:hypothetical protein